MKKSNFDHIDWYDIFKDALLVSFVALVLALPFVGIYTKLEYGKGLTLHFDRISITAISIVSIFFGRIILRIIECRRFLMPIIISASVLLLSLAIIMFPEWFAGTELAKLGYFYFVGSMSIIIFAYYRFLHQNDIAPIDDHEEKQKRRRPILLNLIRTDSLNKLFHSPALVPLIAIILAIIPFTDLSSRSYLDTTMTVLIYIMLGWGLNIIVGLAGLLDLGFVAFYAVGAYSYALLAHYLGLGFWASLPLVGLFAACFGFLLGYPILRLRGDYFAIVTLGFGEIIRLILTNWNEFTGGPNGISGIPAATVGNLYLTRRVPEGGTSFHEYFGLAYDRTDKLIFLYLVILLLVLMTHYFTMRLRKMPVGRAWEAIRENDIAAQSIGINLRNSKLIAFMFSAMLGGFAGCFYSTKLSVISPESFTFMESVIILAIVVLGGFGSQLGIVVGTIFMIGLFEVFRDFEEYQMLAFGIGMIVIMLWRPRGLLSFREPTITMAEYSKAKQKG